MIACAGSRGGPAAPALPAVDRRRAKRRAAWRRRGLVLAFMSPWLVGFCVFFGYPLVYSAYLSSTPTTCSTRRAGSGSRTTATCFRDDPEIWTAVRNTLWLIAIAVPLQVLFAFGIALMLTRAKRGAGFFRTIFYLPALAPPVAATLGFVYLLNPATGPGQHRASTSSGSRGRSGSTHPSWSKPSLTLLAMWGVGNIMVIFLAAILDVPQHLHESAELDGAGAFQRLRWVTLPTISPVILFAVVLGVIQALQYFTQAYVAASIAAGQASQAGTVSTLEQGYPEGSTLFYPDPPLLPRLPLLQHGLRLGDGDAAARASRSR